MKMYSGVEVYFYELNQELDGVEWSASHSTDRDPGTHWTGCWVEVRASLDTMEKRKKNTPPAGN
jgi:hypothetical protein